MKMESAAQEVFTFARESVEAKAALDSGWIGEKRVKVSGVIRDAAEREKILFMTLPPQPALSLGEKVARGLATARAFSLTATAMPCLALLIWGVREGNAPAWGTTIGALLGVLLLQVAINLYNDVSDYRKLIDLPGTPGGSGAFHQGWFTPRQVLQAARIALIAGILLGVPALLRLPKEVLFLGGLGAIGALLYSHERFGLKYHALGDIAVLLLCGPVLTAGFSLAAFGSLLPAYGAIGLFLGLLACALLHVNNLHDIHFDRSRGAATLAVRIGFRRSQTLLYALYLGAGLVLSFAVMKTILPRTSLLALAALIPAYRLCLTVRSALGPSSPQLEGARMRAAQIHLLAGVLLVIGVAIP